MDDKGWRYAPELTRPMTGVYVKVCFPGLCLRAVLRRGWPAVPLVGWALCLGEVLAEAGFGIGSSSLGGHVFWMA